MIFFMTRRKLEEYVNDCCEKIVSQYRIDVIAEYFDKVNRDVATAKREISQVSQAFQTLSSNDRALEEKIIKLQSVNLNCQEVDTEIRKVVGELKDDIAKEIKNNILSQIPAPDIDVNEIKKIVDETIRSSLAQSIGNTNVEEIKQSLKSELGVYVNQSVSSYFNGINNELNKQSKEIQQLKAALSQESSHNLTLSSKIEKQDESIQSLTSTVSIMKAELDKLNEIIRRLELEKLTYVVFGAGLCDNGKIIHNFIQQSKKLRTEISVKFDDEEGIDICLKLIDKCIAKMEALYVKNEENALDSDKLANESAKIFNQTVIKAMSQNKLKDILDRYMQACKIRKLDWHIGKKMTDNDYEYLEEPILYEDVSDERLNNTIRDIKQDTYLIDYVEDEKKYEAIIPGIYCIGRYKN